MTSRKETYFIVLLTKSTNITALRWGPPEYEENVKNLFIGNLSFQTTETELRALLEPFGQVGRVYMPRNRETRQLRGFAFVEMTNDNEAKKTIGALNPKDVRGETLT